MGSKVERFERFERLKGLMWFGYGCRFPDAVWSMLDAKWIMSIGLKSFWRVSGWS